MPELPEVETIKRSLEKKLTGRTITGVDIYLPKIIRLPDPAEFRRQITGRKITGLSRRGKYLLIYLTEKFTLVIHLRMTGQLVYTSPSAPAKHTHAVFQLDNGNELQFIDQRQFGRIILTPKYKLNEVPGLKDLGVEPLGNEFQPDSFQRELLRRRGRIKSLLLNQTFIAGLGNIYVDEALHRAHINPRRIASSLTPEEVTNLYHAIRNVLREGIKYRGTTFRDYVDGNGRTGNFQERLRVYNREGKPCYNCNTKISRIKLGGRSSYFCPRCQKTK